MDYTSNSQFTKNLKPLEVIPHKYHSIFAEYPCFNFVQSSVIDDIIYGDESIVVSAPTGSGKTALFELAIVRTLITFERTQFQNTFKIIYIAPMKALCEERLVDWHRKFSDFGLNCISVTGDSQHVDFKDLFAHNLIITTPEKWDCLTRKWRDNHNLMKVIKLFLIDEIHILNEEARGPTLEAIVCRMKTMMDMSQKIRFLALSATIPNIEDIAEWIGGSSAKYFKFSEEARPVKLNKIVVGYNFTHKSYFKFDLGLSYRLPSLIKQHSEGKPTLIFCCTRKMVEMTTTHLLQNYTVNMSDEHKDRLQVIGQSLSDDNVKNALVHGCGMHHAGMLPSTRHIVENSFRDGELPILVTTSTLAMGINLPAHLVIIKSTKCYRNGGFCDYSETELTQMIGRAGRPQFDTTATVLILTTLKEKLKFEKMVGGSDPIESSLHLHLIEHINAEIVLRTITHMDVAMSWLSSTYLYVRARKNPKHYGLAAGSSGHQLDRKLLEMCQIELNRLNNAGMITIHPDVELEATPTGTLMARYYLSFQTMKLFIQLSGQEILQQALAVMSKCHEFSEMYLRVNDKKCLNLLNKCKDQETIRFPLTGRIKTLDMKINCLIQAAFGCLDVSDHSLMTDTLKIMRHGERITKCLIEYLELRPNNNYQAKLSAITLAKCFATQLWENSPHILKQLTGIGIVTSTQFAKFGKTTNEAVLNSDARQLEIIMNRKPPAGTKILEQIKALPKYFMQVERASQRELRLEIRLVNADDIKSRCTITKNSLMYLIVGDSNNDVLLYEKYLHSQMVNSSQIVKILEIRDEKIEYVRAHFISENWVGIDCSCEVILIEKDGDKNKSKKSKKSSKKATNPTEEKRSTNNYMHTFLEKYDKLKPKITKHVVNSISNEGCSTSGQNVERKIIITENLVLRSPFKNCTNDITENPESKPEIEELNYLDYADEEELAYLEKLYSNEINNQKLEKKPNTSLLSYEEIIENEKSAADKRSSSESSGFDGKKFKFTSKNISPKLENTRCISLPSEEIIEDEKLAADKPLRSEFSGYDDKKFKFTSKNIFQKMENKLNISLPYEEIIEDDKLAADKSLSSESSGYDDKKFKLTSKNIFQKVENKLNLSLPSEEIIEDEKLAADKTLSSKSSGFDVKKFAFSSKKMSHQYDNNNNPPEKRMKLIDDGLSRKKISWGSPLLLQSPAEKYSPTLNLEHRERSSHDNSIATSNKSAKIAKPRLQQMLQRIPRTSSAPFPLADKHFSIEETRKNQKLDVSSSHIQQKSSQTSDSTMLEDLCSKSLLEQLGLVTNAIEKNNVSRNSTESNNIARKSSNVPSATDYYTHLMTKSSRRSFDDGKSSQSVQRTTAVPSNSSYEEFSKGITQPKPIRSAYFNQFEDKEPNDCSNRRVVDVEDIPTRFNDRSMEFDVSMTVNNEHLNDRRSDSNFLNTRMDDQQPNVSTRDPRFMGTLGTDQDDNFGYDYLQMANQQNVPIRRSHIENFEDQNAVFLRNSVNNYRPDVRSYQREVEFRRPYAHHCSNFVQFPQMDTFSAFEFGSQSHRNEFARPESYHGEGFSDRRYLRPQQYPNRSNDMEFDPYGYLPNRSFNSLSQCENNPYYGSFYDGNNHLSYCNYREPVQYPPTDNRYYPEEPSTNLRAPNYKDFVLSKFFQSMDKGDPHY